MTARRAKKEAEKGKITARRAKKETQKEKEPLAFEEALPLLNTSGAR